MAGAVKMIDVKRRSHGTLSRLVQVLRPDALEPVPLRQEVKNTHIRRPPWRGVDTRSIGYPDPLAFASRHAVAERRNEDRRAAFFHQDRHMKREPIAIRREAGSMNVVSGVTNCLHSLSGDNVDSAVISGIP